MFSPSRSRLGPPLLHFLGFPFIFDGILVMAPILAFPLENDYSFLLSFFERPTEKDIHLAGTETDTNERASWLGKGKKNLEGTSHLHLLFLGPPTQVFSFIEERKVVHTLRSPSSLPLLARGAAKWTADMAAFLFFLLERGGMGGQGWGGVVGSDEGFFLFESSFRKGDNSSTGSWTFFSLLSPPF